MCQSNSQIQKRLGLSSLLWKGSEASDPLMAHVGQVQDPVLISPILGTPRIIHGGHVSWAWQGPLGQV